MTIDMHAHWFPDSLVDALRHRGARPRIFTREDGREYLEGLFDRPLGHLERLEERIADMDAHGVERAIVSVPPMYGVEGLPPQESAALCRTLNQGLSEVCVAYPDRFSGLASLPIRDLDVAIAELDYAMTLPGMMGALLPGDGFLTLQRAEKFRPLFEAANRDGALILVHYGQLPNDSDTYKIDASDNSMARLQTLDMQARLSQNMITFCLTDYLAAFPNLTVLVHNLGGNIPYEVERMDHRHLMTSQENVPSDRFRAAPVLVDCNSLGAHALEAAVGLYGSNKIVYGSDGTAFGMDWTNKAIEQARISDADRQAIRRDNAAALIERMRRRTAAVTV